MIPENDKNIRILINKGVYLVLVVSLISFILGLGINTSLAEQSGSSPDSGLSKSVLSTGYDFLVSKGSTYGSSSSPDWTYNWGTYWNRIMYSASWEPDGTATTSDVVSGKTFYSGLNNRTIQTGTVSSLASVIDYAPQMYSHYTDDVADDYTEEESTWSNTATSVWKDNRTGLYWSINYSSTTNSFTVASCDFFTTTPRGSYGTSGTDPDCGSAINGCAALSLASTGGASDTDWYLPSQKEQVQAYLDGIFNKTDPTWLSGDSAMWSSTERSNDTTDAWYIIFDDGLNFNITDKTGSLPYRCVRRD